MYVGCIRQSDYIWSFMNFLKTGGSQEDPKRPYDPPICIGNSLFYFEMFLHKAQVLVSFLEQMGESQKYRRGGGDPDSVNFQRLTTILVSTLCDCGSPSISATDIFI